jgi:hypothetical protein
MTDEAPVIPELNRRMLLRGGLAAGAGLAVAGLGTFGLSKAAEALTFDVQLYWAYCNNCLSLWYTNNNTAGVCAYEMYKSGGGGHIKSPSYSYSLSYNVSGSGGSYQPGWNWCRKCQCLFFANNSSESACPANNQLPHTTGGFAYSVLYNDYVSGVTQPNWWWCGECQGLFFSPDGQGGYCPATQDYGSGHFAGQGSLFDPPIINSFAYDLIYYSTSPP